MSAFQREGETVTIKKLQSLLEIECNVKASRSVVRKILKRLGYQWGAVQKVGVRRKRPDLTLELREFLLKYSEALRKQSSGKYVIVYMDESYVHERHSKNYTWFHPNSDDKNRVFCGTGKGKRLIIVHALTKDGLLNVKGHERQQDTEQLDDSRAKTAEWVFVGPVKKADYHKNMNGENFMKWVKQRLIPAFKTQYSNGEKMILVLDNAPYHHCRGENYVDPKKLKRTELFNELILLAKKTTMKILRGSKEVIVDLANLRKTARGSLRGNVPVNGELRAELSEWLERHPEHTTGQLQTLFDELGWELLWTPPYTPTLQPIELTWAHCKGYVAEHFFTGRNIEDTRNALFDAFYGAGSYKGYTVELAQKHIAHCHSWCDVYIENDTCLAGDIFNVRAIDADPTSSSPSVQPSSSSSSSVQSSSSSSSSSSSALVQASRVPSSSSSSSLSSASSDSSRNLRDYLGSIAGRSAASRQLHFDENDSDEGSDYESGESDAESGDGGDDGFSSENDSDSASGDSDVELEESEGEEDDFLQDDSFDRDDVYFGAVSFSDDDE